MALPTILPHVPHTQAPTQDKPLFAVYGIFVDGPALLNIARAGRQWFVEHEGEGRKAVASEVGQAMVDAAHREGAVARVHRWGEWTTWHLVRQPGRLDFALFEEPLARPLQAGDVTELEGRFVRMTVNRSSHCLQAVDCHEQVVAAMAHRLVNWGS